MQPPNDPMMAPQVPPAGAGTAQDQLNVPSIAIISMAAIGILSALYGFATGGQALPDEQLRQLPPDMRPMLELVARYGRFINVFSLLIDGFMIYGALQMRALKGYGIAMATAVICVIPCMGGCCCLIGIPIGIWTLVILNKPEVKSAFT